MLGVFRLHGRVRFTLAASSAALAMGCCASAQAANECGAVPASRAIVCTAAGNPYATGINYTDFNGSLSLTTNADVRVTGGISLFGVGVQTVNNNGVIQNGTAAGIRITSFATATATSPGAIGTIGDYSPGIALQGVTNSVNAASITTAGYLSSGISVLGQGNASTTSIIADSVRTSGNSANGIEVIPSQDAVITVRTGSVVTTGTSSTGIAIRSVNLFATTGAINVTADTVSTAGAGANGIDVSNYFSGPVTIKVGSVTVSGADEKTAINAFTMRSTVDVTATNVVGTNARGIFADGYFGTTVTSQNVSATGDFHAAIAALTPPSGFVNPGATRVTTTGVTSATGAAAQGIYATAGSGSVVVDSATTITTGRDSDAIYAFNSLSAGSPAQDVSVRAATTTAAGTNSAAIRAISNSGATSVTVLNRATSQQSDAVVLSSVAASNATVATGAVVSGVGSGIAVTGSNGSTVTNAGAVSGTVNGVAIRSSAGASAINSGTINGGATGVTINAATGGSVTNSGTITGGTTGVAISGTTGGPVMNSGSISGGTTGVTINAASGASITNSGTIGGGIAGYSIEATGAGALAIVNSGQLGGRIRFTSAADSIVNSGTFAATVGQDFGAGNDSFANSGRIAVLPGTTTAGNVAFANLESLTNSGLIDLRNGHAATSSPRRAPLPAAAPAPSRSTSSSVPCR